MKMKENLFTNYKFRCSSLGHILTNRKEITQELLDSIKVLKDERDFGINLNGNKVKWTENKQVKLDALIDKRDKPDELPSGAITHLDNVFRSVYWGRKRLLYNKYLDKGNIGESDSLQLMSDVDGVFYTKNEEHFENDYIMGTPDNNQVIIRDAKTNYDQESFDNAELSSLYKNQIKGYCWLDKKTKGELVYCLVNNPYHQLMQEKTGIYYKLGTPDDDEERYIKAKQQSERNMIFDIAKWKENYPNYDFENTILDFDIPEIMRIKKFEVELLPEDISFMKGRVVLARNYLINKEKQVINKIKEYENR